MIMNNSTTTSEEPKATTTAHPVKVTKTSQWSMLENTLKLNIFLAHSSIHAYPVVKV